MAEALPTAAELLALTPLGDDRFRSEYTLDNLTGAIFGGQLLALALAAAQRTAPDWPAHMIAGQFLARAEAGQAIELAVERTRDGRRYAGRRVIVRQGGRTVFDLLASFNAAEETPGYGAATPPDAPPPETLRSQQDFATAHAARFPPFARAIHARPFPVELRMVDPERAYFEGAGAVDYWVRLPAAAAVAAADAQACLLALVSDYWLAGAASGPLRGAAGPAITGTVAINHAMWFHAPARCEEWMLFRTTAEWAGNGRGMARGRLLDRGGRLLASVMQETAIAFADA